MSTTAEHAKCSPSSAHRWTVCTAAPAEEAKHPDSDSEPARRGTFLHTIAERVLRDPRGGRAVDLVGTQDPLGEFTLDEEMADGVDAYIDAVWFCMETSPGIPTLHVEARVQFSPDLWGTTDAIVLHRDDAGELLRIDVFDLKGGSGVYVEADENLQLACYLLAAVADGGADLDDDLVVGLHIVQPLHHAGSPWRVWTPTIRRLREIKQQIQVALFDVQHQPEFVPGDHCHWCRAAATCHARREFQLATAADAFNDDPAPVATLTPQAIANLLRRFPDLRSWMSDVEAHAERMALAGTPIPGHKLVQRVGNRAWNDDQQAEANLRGLGVDPFTSALISPAEAERRLHLITGTTKKRAADLVNAVCHKPITGTTLVDASDKRPEFVPPNFNDS